MYVHQYLFDITKLNISYSYLCYSTESQSGPSYLRSFYQFPKKQLGVLVPLLTKLP